MPEIDGAAVRAAREAVGWSRKDLVALTGISEAKIARIELKGTGTQEELDAVRAALRNQLGVAVGATDAPIPNPPKKREPKVEPAPTNSPSLTGHLPDGARRYTEWNGLKRGDLFQIRGERGRFRFVYYHEDDHQRYVECSGPVTRYHDRTLGRQQRSVVPERVVIPNATRRNRDG